MAIPLSRQGSLQSQSGDNNGANANSSNSFYYWKLPLLTFIVCYGFVFYSYSDKSYSSSSNENIMKTQATSTRIVRESKPLQRHSRFDDIIDRLDDIAASNFELDLNLDTFYLDKPFNTAGDDLMIHIHIQKTGGTTFEDHLHSHISNCKQKTEPPSKHDQFTCCRNTESYGQDNYGIITSKMDVKRDVSMKFDNTSVNRKPLFDQLYRKFMKTTLENPMNQCTQNGKYDTWLFSRYSPCCWFCGVHADYTTLRECVPTMLPMVVGEEKAKKAKFVWITNMRDGLERFLSEWQHVKRGASWNKQYTNCNAEGHYWNEFESKCFNTTSKEKWKDVELEEYVDCLDNPGFNRLTKHLGDLDEVGCFETISTTDPNNDGYQNQMVKLLKSAKKNLNDKIAYFSLNDEQRLSQWLFEQTFGMEFGNYNEGDFPGFYQKSGTVAARFESDISDNLLSRVKHMNTYDIELSDYARKLFYARIKTLRLREMSRMNRGVF